jgi:hypothetical protein
VKAMIDSNPNIASEAISARNNRKAVSKIAQYWTPAHRDVLHVIVKAAPDELSFQNK